MRGSNALLRIAEMYAADRLAVQAGVLEIDLMEAAGRAVAHAIEDRYTRRPVVVLCGPGNNGGDGFVVARVLKEKGWPVRVGLLGRRIDLAGAAAVNADRWDGDVEPLELAVLDGCHLAVDAVFGAGLTRGVSGAVADVIDALNEMDIDVVAIDMPSGVNGDTGQVQGSAPRCALTVTFFRPKPGHFLMPGTALVGDLVVADIGIPDAVLDDIAPVTAVNGPGLWVNRLPQPEGEVNNYGRGHAVIVGGTDMPGAARLAARAARRIGAGLATIACVPTAFPIYAAGDPGTLVKTVEGRAAFADFIDDARRNAVLVGPGGGVSEETAHKALSVLATDKAVVLDADALSAFGGKSATLFDVLADRDPDLCLLTPHDGEFKRLFAWEGDRLTRARSAASECGAVVLLKGPDTVIAHPDGRAVINTGAPPTLATAGTGDVLAGLALGLMAQGVGAFDAGCMAAWIHGQAAALFGPGLIAEDLANLVPDILESLSETL